MDWGVLWRVSGGGAVWYEWVKEGGRKGRVSAILILVWYWYATSIWIGLGFPPPSLAQFQYRTRRLSLVLLVAFGFIHLVSSVPFLPSSPGRSFLPAHGFYCTQENPDLQRSVRRFTRSCSRKAHTHPINREPSFWFWGFGRGERSRALGFDSTFFI